jgi:RNA polymerase sigma-70 factor (ECF subfamily)
VRGLLRRRRREESTAGVGLTQAAAAGAEVEDGASSSAVRGWVWHADFLASLPRSLRVVARLASADLCAAEIRWLLGLTDTALRQRLTALRRAVGAAGEAPTLPASEPRSSFGGPRAWLLAGLRRQQGRVVATHDPDGHVILLRIGPHKTGLDGNL